MSKQSIFTHVIVGLCLLSFTFSGCAKSSSTSSQTSEMRLTQSTKAFACAGDVSCSSQSENSDQLDEALASFTPMDFELAISFFEQEKSGILYFGFYDCPWCQDIAPILSDVASEKGEEVFYIQTRDDDRNRLYTDEQKERIIPYLGHYMSENKEGILTLYVPLIVRVEEGKVTMAHQGTIEGHQAADREMSKDEREKVYQVIQKMFG